jgi:hypothetical protein
MLTRGLNCASASGGSNDNPPDIRCFANITVRFKGELLGQQVRSTIQGAAVGQLRFRPWWGEWVWHAFSFGEVENMIMPNSPLSAISPELVNY